MYLTSKHLLFFIVKIKYQNGYSASEFKIYIGGFRAFIPFQDTDKNNYHSKYKISVALISPFNCGCRKGHILLQGSQKFRIDKEIYFLFLMKENKLNRNWIMGRSYVPLLRKENKYDRVWNLGKSCYCTNYWILIQRV